MTTTSPVSCDSAEDGERLRHNLARVHERINASGRDPRDVRVVAVTKTFSAQDVRVAAMVGLTTFGENYVDELCRKRREVDNPATQWHYLGVLQTNKIARVLGCADVVCSLSRTREVERVAALAPGASVYCQVDVTGGATRNGVAPAHFGDLVLRARDAGLDVRGVMVVAPVEPSAARAAFQLTRALADQWRLDECSMGMSNDLELACQSGTTELRIGRALFGPRV